MKAIDNKKEEDSEDDGAWIVKDDNDMDEDEPAPASKPRKDKGASEMYEKVSTLMSKYWLTCSSFFVVAHATSTYLETSRHVHRKY